MQLAPLQLGAISGILSAGSAVAVMQPIDTARAYVYLQPHIHKNVIAAFKHIALNEGPWALYKGSKAHLFRTVGLCKLNSVGP